MMYRRSGTTGRTKRITRDNLPLGWNWIKTQPYMPYIGDTTVFFSKEGKKTHCDWL